MFELLVTDLARSLAWYQTVATAELLLEDRPRGFLLLSLPNSPTRLALKQMATNGPRSGNVTVHFQIDSCDAEAARLASAGLQPYDTPKISDEGYRRLRYEDPDGNTVILFEWLAPPRVTV